MNLYDFTKCSPAAVIAKRTALLKSSPVYILAIPKATKCTGGVEWEAQGQFMVETNGIANDEQLIVFLRYIADYLEASASDDPPTEEGLP